MVASHSQSESESSATYALLETNLDGQILCCSEDLQKLLGTIGITKDQFSHGERLATIKDSQESGAGRQLIESLIEDAQADVDQQSRDIVFDDGTTLDCTFLRHGSGEKRRFVWIFRDVTIEREEQDRLRFQSEVLGRVSDAVITVNENLAITYWNHGAHALTGYTSEAAVGKGIEDLIQFRFPTPEEERIAWASMADHGSWNGEMIIKTPTSERERFVSTSASILHDEEGEFGGLLAVVRDETERREMEDKLIHHAFHDLLTGLP